MTAAVLPFPGKPKPSRAGARFFAMKEAETHAQLGAEVKAMFDAMRATERAMEEFAEEFPGDFWRDESFILTLGLPV